MKVARFGGEGGKSRPNAVPLFCEWMDFSRFRLEMAFGGHSLRHKACSHVGFLRSLVSIAGTLVLYSLLRLFFVFH
jgi:hypothetical protein